jgi:hypothetical protein
MFFERSMKHPRREDVVVLADDGPKRGNAQGDVSPPLADVRRGNDEEPAPRKPKSGR